MSQLPAREVNGQYVVSITSPVTNEINDVIWNTGHNIDAVTEDKTGHTKLFLLQRAPGEPPVVPVPRCLWAVHRVR